MRFLERYHCPVLCGKSLVVVEDCQVFFEVVVVEVVASRSSLVVVYKPG